MTNSGLVEASLKIRTLFFFLQVLDIDYEKNDPNVRALVDGFFKTRFGLDSNVAAADGVLPFLQIKTLIVFLFPFVAAMRSDDLKSKIEDSVPKRWEVVVTPGLLRNGQPKKVSGQLVLDITRHAMAHLFDPGVDDAGKQGINWDDCKFISDSGTAKFSQKGLAHFAQDIIEHVRLAARDKLTKDKSPAPG